MFSTNILALCMLLLYFSTKEDKINGIEASSFDKVTNCDSLFSVFRVDSIDNYYLVYAKMNNLKYKIISKKDSCINKIQFQKLYKLSLKSVFSGVSSYTRLSLSCYTFDNNTIICIEKDSINDLYVTENLRGLCFVP